MIEVAAALGSHTQRQKYDRPTGTRRSRSEGRPGKAKNVLMSASPLPSTSWEKQKPSALSTALPSHYDIYSFTTGNKKRSLSAEGTRKEHKLLKPGKKPVVAADSKAASSRSNIFKDLELLLEFSTSTSYKEKVSLKKSITDNGGTLTYILTKKTDYLVACHPQATESYRAREAVKRGVLVVNWKFIEQCLSVGRVVEYEPYVVAGLNRTDQLSHGTISATQKQKEGGSRKPKRFIDMQKLKLWRLDDCDLPSFTNDFVVVKWAFFESITASSAGSASSVVVEVNATRSEKAENGFRILQSHWDPNESMCTFASSGEDAETIFSNFLSALMKTRKYKKRITPPSSLTGSMELNEMFWKWSVDREVSKSVANTVDHLWDAAVGEINSVLAVPFSHLTLAKVEEAEAVLLMLSRQLCLRKQNSGAERHLIKSLDSFQADFYTALPHSQKYKVPIDCLAQVAKKRNTCQLLRDLIATSEVNTLQAGGGAQPKLRALKCCLTDTSLPSEIHEQFVKVGYKLLGVHEVTKSPSDSFLRGQDNERLLYHSSGSENFVGILSRGLLLPKILIEKFGIVRTDEGKLGSGIYFTDDVTTACGYSSPSRTNVRFMLVCRVALGDTQVYHEKHTDLVHPPEGFNSVQGEPGPNSEFTSNEFVIYSLDRYQIAYIVTFQAPSDPEPLDAVTGMDVESTASNTLSDAIDLADVSGIKNPLDELHCGLKGADDKAVPMTAMHIRARLVDLASEVTVYQTFHNTSDSSLEGKFVFPLSEAAAVCAFEVFINNKHVVGVVKEKETARREYKEAIQAGHGAFLLDQDKERPDIFTISLGNVPSRAYVRVKIVYVSELLVEGERILFNLPASLTPEKERENLLDQTQSTLDSVQVRKTNDFEMSLKLSIEMPYDLRDIYSPSHSLRIKRSLTKAQIELRQGQHMNDGFQMSFTLAEIHVPRMWVEKARDPTQPSACMLTFYPEFEIPGGVLRARDLEVFLLLDCSTSMDSCKVELRKAALLCLASLPDYCRFNVLKYGSGYEELFISCQVKSKRTEEQAKVFIMSGDVSLGGTELYNPMVALSYLARSDSPLTRNLFVFSDGNVTDSSRLLSTATAVCPAVRIFTFGIGSLCNNNFMRRLANVSAGYCEIFNAKTKSKWEGQVVGQIEKARQPCLTSASVDWQIFCDDVLEDHCQAPQNISAIFNGTRLVVYGMVNCSQVYLHATIGGVEVDTVVSTRQMDVVEGDILHRLATRALIQDWENGLFTIQGDETQQKIKKMDAEVRMIEMSKRYSIVTKLTSFVAIEKRGEGNQEVPPDVENPFDMDENVDCLPSVSWDNDDDGWDDDGELLDFYMPSNSSSASFPDGENEVSYLDDIYSIGSRSARFERMDDLMEKSSDLCDNASIFRAVASDKRQAPVTAPKYHRMFKGHIPAGSALSPVYSPTSPSLGIDSAPATPRLESEQSQPKRLHEQLSSLLQKRRSSSRLASMRNSSPQLQSPASEPQDQLRFSKPMAKAFTVPNEERLAESLENKASTRMDRSAVPKTVSVCKISRSAAPMKLVTKPDVPIVISAASMAKPPASVKLMKESYDAPMARSAARMARSAVPMNLSTEPDALMARSVARMARSAAPMNLSTEPDAPMARSATRMTRSAAPMDLSTEPNVPMARSVARMARSAAPMNLSTEPDAPTLMARSAALMARSVAPMGLMTKSGRLSAPVPPLLPPQGRLSSSMSIPAAPMKLVTEPVTPMAMSAAHMAKPAAPMGLAANSDTSLGRSFASDLNMSYQSLRVNDLPKPLFMDVSTADETATGFSFGGFSGDSGTDRGDYGGGGDGGSGYGGGGRGGGGRGGAGGYGGGPYGTSNYSGGLLGSFGVAGGKGTLGAISSAGPVKLSLGGPFGAAGSSGPFGAVGRSGPFGAAGGSGPLGAAPSAEEIVTSFSRDSQHSRYFSFQPHSLHPPILYGGGGSDQSETGASSSAIPASDTHLSEESDPPPPPPPLPARPGRKSLQPPPVHSLQEEEEEEVFADCCEMPVYMQDLPFAEAIEEYDSMTLKMDFANDVQLEQAVPLKPPGITQGPIVQLESAHMEPMMELDREHVKPMMFKCMAMGSADGLVTGQNKKHLGERSTLLKKKSIRGAVKGYTPIQEKTKLSVPKKLLKKKLMKFAKTFVFSPRDLDDMVGEFVHLIEAEFFPEALIPKTTDLKLFLEKNVEGVYGPSIYCQVLAASLIVACYTVLYGLHLGPAGEPHTPLHTWFRELEQHSTMIWASPACDRSDKSRSPLVANISTTSGRDRLATPDSVGSLSRRLLESLRCLSQYNVWTHCHQAACDLAKLYCLSMGQSVDSNGSSSDSSDDSSSSDSSND